MQEHINGLYLKLKCFKCKDCPKNDGYEDFRYDAQNYLTFVSKNVNLLT